MELLNPQQRQVVASSASALAVIAGPGTGKTKTLTARIAHLVESGQATPQQILAMTFTNKAAHEMHQRVAAQLKGREAPQITTFHAFCNRLLHQTQQTPLQFITDTERLAVIRELPRPDSLASLSVRELALDLSRYKNAIDTSQFDPGLARLAKRYDQKLQEYQLSDFDNLLIDAQSLLAAGQIKMPFTHLLIDEFQDTNELQYDLMQRLNVLNVLVIGDPHQSIYGFRGANGSIFRRFQKDLQAQIITLKTNYRSHTAIVDTAKAIFPGELELEAHTKSHGQVNIIKTLNEYTEAAYIINTIQEYLGGTDLLNAHNNNNASIHHFSDFAILYRTHRTARTIIRKLQESGMPYQVAGEESPYATPFMRTLITLLGHCVAGTQPSQREHRMLTLLKKPAQDTAFLLGQCRTQAKTPIELVESIIEKFGLAQQREKHQDDYRQLTNRLIGLKDAAITEVAQHLSKLAQSNYYDPSADAITLLTIHAAKGLEFKHVFLCAAEENVLPHSRKGSDSDEEKRLFYVAVTRAKAQLDILYATERAHQAVTSSRFLAFNHLAHQTDPSFHAEQKRNQRRHQKRAQTTLFDL